STSKTPSYTKSVSWQHHRVRQLPAERCPAIERATRGEVLCEELRPDIDWSYLRRSACCSQNMSVKQLNDSNKSSFDHT
ncbi:transcriptional regulator, partial [Escherichia coli]|nr:transcriptional regulator [Escherichia coli]